MRVEAKVILFFLMGGVVYLDTDTAGQFILSQPLIAGAIAGAILGNWLAGLTVGLLMQLPNVIEIPAGGAKVAVGNLGAYVAAGLAAHFQEIYPLQSNFILIFFIFGGVLLSWGAAPLQDGVRRLNRQVVQYADRAAAAGNLAQITRLNYLGVALAFLFGAGLCALSFYVGKMIGEPLIALIGLRLESAAACVKSVLLGAGVGAMFWRFGKKSTLSYTALGAAMSILVWLLIR